MRAHEVSRRALAAVAKLTLLAGAAGCGNVIIEKDAPAKAPNEPGDATPYEPPDAVIGGDEEACFEGMTDSAMCCEALLLKSFSDPDLFNDPTLATDEEKACCDLAVAVMDQWVAEGAATEPPFNYNTPNNCCGTGLVEGGFEAHPSCTPWGPPMPPLMLAGFDLRDLEVYT